jgi:hypothetical protein
MKGGKLISYYRNPGQKLEMLLGIDTDWDGFEDMLKLLQEKCNLELKEILDGPDVRTGFLEREGIKLELHYDDPYDMSIIAPVPESEDTLRKLGEELRPYLTNFSKN